MLGSPVTFVVKEPIDWIKFMEPSHPVVTKNLGHDRRRSDGCAQAIAMHDRTLRDLEIRDRETVDQHEVRVVLHVLGQPGLAARG